MEKRNILFGLTAATLMLVMAQSGIAQDAAGAGSTALGTLQEAITGNIGLILGLGITVMGLWTWIVGQKTGAGLTMVVGGVLITLAPGLFNGARTMMGGVINQFSGGNATAVQGGGQVLNDSGSGARNH